ncbi:MAG TPA: PAS domain-containing protein [Methylocella sp.]|nr:PAS domain-containing protein [Methylocella sp.]
MGTEDDLLALIDLVYEAAFDSELWTVALSRLADVTGTAQVGLACMDCLAHTYDSIAPRMDPVLNEKYKSYWAFHNPVWARAAQQPVGKVFLFDSIMSRKAFSTTPVFNEWFRPAEFGLAIVAANLFVGDQVSALLCAANTPKNDLISPQQVLAFKIALPHIDRALRIHREFWIRDLDHDTAPERLESLQRGVILVDGAARVLFANAAARSLFGSEVGLTVRAGRLHSTDGEGAVQGLIASCIRKAPAPRGPGGQISITRGPHTSPLRVTVMPLRSKGNVAELPWLSVDIPVAIVTVSDPASETWMN